MHYRKLGKTGFMISEVSLGAWQIGGKWGDDFSYETASATLNAAVDRGVNFIDTADVYSDGESEKAVGHLLRSRSERIYVATKCGRRINPHVNAGYTPEALRAFVEGSLNRLGIDCLTSSNCIARLPKSITGRRFLSCSTGSGKKAKS